MNVTVIGAGYVGCVTAACLARRGHNVLAVDTRASKVKMLQTGQSPVFEPGLGDLIAEVVRSGRLCASLPSDESLDAARIAFVCVATPGMPDGSVDVRPMQRVFAAIAQSLVRRREPLIVAVRSTVPPNRLRSIVAELDPNVRAKLRLVANPEFLRETTAIADFDRPPFVILGGDDKGALAECAGLFSDIKAPLHRTDLESALLVKYACNAFHGVKISFANEVARIADIIGANPLKVMSIFAEDTILNVSKVYLRPGFAFGGSCLPKDLRALVALGKETEEPLPLLQGALESNEQRIDRASDVIVASGVRSVAMLGLSFKRGTDDLRESPYLLLAKKLIDRGLVLKIHDPDVDPQHFVGANLKYAVSVLPGLPALLMASVQETLAGAGGIVVCKRLLQPDEILRLAGSRHVFDLEYIVLGGGLDVASPYRRPRSELCSSGS